MAQNRNYMLADGLFRLARQGNGIQLFLRYRARAERLYRRAVDEFERLKKLRPELPNQPISDAAPGGAGDLVTGQPLIAQMLLGQPLPPANPIYTRQTNPFLPQLFAVLVGQAVSLRTGLIRSSGRRPELYGCGLAARRGRAPEGPRQRAFASRIPPASSHVDISGRVR